MPRFTRSTLHHPRPPPASPWSLWLDRLKGLSERLALLLGLLYGLGYATRSLHAWFQNLGSLPGARLDYLVAGFVLLIPFAFAGALIGTLWRGVHGVRTWAWQHRALAQRLQLHVFAPMAAAGLLLAVAARFLPSAMGWAMAPAATLLIVGVVMGSLLATSTPGPRSTGRWRARLRKLGGWMLGLYVLVLGLLVSALLILIGERLLAQVPQEFGGVAPRCAYLDLLPEQLSPESRRLLLAPGETEGVRRSRPVQVHAAGDPWLLGVSLGPGQRQPVRLAEAAVRSAVWLPLAACE